jgi:hypothetical protein
VLAEGVVLEAEVIAESTFGSVEVPAPKITEEVHDDALLDTSMDVVVRSPEIQDAEPIRSAPMSEIAAASRDGLELLADDLINPTTVACNLESMRRAEQWMKVRDGILEQSNSSRTEHPSNNCCLVQDVMERSRQKSDML